MRLSQELGIKIFQIAATAQLLAEGATVPFIARYRKEATGELDEVQVTSIRDRLEQLAQLDERRASILSSLKERNLLTPELEKAIAAAETALSQSDGQVKTAILVARGMNTADARRALERSDGHLAPNL